jgi:hypothetical protein
MKTPKSTPWNLTAVILCHLLAAAGPALGTIPLPEHPRPDFQRAQWLNLNGPWQFQFDPNDRGLTEKWFESKKTFSDEIRVPFSWGSPLSGMEDQADIGWYARTLQVPEDWQKKRVFLVIGACDWHTTAWLDGKPLGTHQGGYTPFEFDLSEHLTPGRPHRLVLRVDDTPHPFKLEGKQGYGRAAGIWQTVYLEARPEVAIETVHFTPDIDRQRVSVSVQLNQPAPQSMLFEIRFQLEDRPKAVFVHSVSAMALYFIVEIPLDKPRLWSLDDPFLYHVTAVLKDPNQVDEVKTYFGMRKIGVDKLPGTDIPYVTLNNKPIYLQMSLDQAYHPEGYYTFPSDTFVRDEILRSRQIGLNGQRVHIKVPLPRKLYWADRLGMLIMADVPNFWGPPDEQAQAESEFALRGMIRRDYNHPCIFSWVNFNETWGLFSGKGRDRVYKPETQAWVEHIYRLTKQLDPSRLVEDNSPCNYDHVATDLNTWHAYLPGYAWEDKLDAFCADTYPGSGWNFVKGRQQDNQPMFNSECGNVWGYEGSTGDIDWSWDYHMMINAFRRHPKCCGWLYTEHHDVINEWNGYWRYDRSAKDTGLGDFVPGMTLRDLHSPFFLALDPELCREVTAGSALAVPLFLSVFTDQAPGTVSLEASLYGWDTLGQRLTYWATERSIATQPWSQRELTPLQVTLPEESCLCVLTTVLRDSTNRILHRNFTTFVVSDNEAAAPAGSRSLHTVAFDPNSFIDARWSLKQWNTLDGLKVSGAGAGFFEYHVPWPEDLTLDNIEMATLRLEVSAKQLFGKDRDGAGKQDGDFMRGKGTHDPSLNPNAYPMTDETRYPSRMCVRVNGVSAGLYDLPDDPADHRGVLSWFSQKRDRHLREAGSYGYLIDATLPAEALLRASAEKSLVIRLEVDDALAGGLAIYGKRFGRYPMDPTLLFALRQ